VTRFKRWLTAGNPCRRFETDAARQATIARATLATPGDATQWRRCMAHTGAICAPGAQTLQLANAAGLQQNRRLCAKAAPAARIRRNLKSAASSHDRLACLRARGTSWSRAHKNMKLYRGRDGTCGAGRRRLRKHGALGTLKSGGAGNWTDAGGHAYEAMIGPKRAASGGEGWAEMKVDGIW